ncbi:ras and EF-hand domain-containing protein homolog [Chanos chanos]|uniref:Ras and EF-hand domain-containing protein homolog n=1 Tax=Chanos chanos TaxID=29144 RepID=A0A6J2X0S4_CHACN|nr:ras and EF-hand domain-containing protein homolog [Chanos chanos]
MAEFTHVRATRVHCTGSDKGEEGIAQAKQSHERRGSDWGGIAMLDKTEEFFQICDSERKGYITRTDMRRLHTELPLSEEELENVFDSLDSDNNGFLTRGEFSSGFSDFLHGRRVSKTDESVAALSPKVLEALYESQWDEELTGNEDEEERHFSMLMESLGASNVFEDPGEVRCLWAQLRKDEPHLLSNFEEFLARVTYQIKEAQQERREMESALQRKVARHDSEIRRLYEEMELQIKNEKDQLILKDSERLQLHSQDLQQQLRSKEQDLEQLFQKQRKLERQCRELHTEHQESRVENVKLKLTNEELSRELEHTCRELSLAQEQLAVLQEQASRLQQEREMEMYRITEGLQREKQSLMRQLDLLREMNKHLRDEKDISSLKAKNSMKNSTRKPRLSSSSSSLKRFDRKVSTCSEGDVEEVTQGSGRKSTVLPNGYAPYATSGGDGKAEVEDHAKRKGQGDRGKKPHDALTQAVEDVDPEDAPPVGWPLRRVISIEEDHLPHLLQGEPQPLLHQLSEEEEVDIGGTDLEMSSLFPSNVSLASTTGESSPPPSRGKTPPSRTSKVKSNTPTTARGQPVGKETRRMGPVEGAVTSPDRLFKVVLVGNSSVGKTALLRRFCDGRFHSSTSATVGIDYSVRTLNLGDSHVALQLWDTAGQERYRSITKQYFRKADGVVIIYDVTMQDSFRSVRPWLTNIHEAVEDAIPIMLLGNKADKENEREVQAKEGERLAEETQLLFYECSAYTGYNVLEAMTHLARVLKEQEDREREKTVVLEDAQLRKKPCCK